VKIFLSHLLLFLIVLSALGQDTTVVLPVVKVVEEIRKNQTGSIVVDLKTDKNQSVAEALNESGVVFIKSYGQGSLATAAVRGSNSNHLAVLWNGVPLQSPMLGLLDLSLLPIGFFESTQLNLGGGSSAWGNGAIGGTLLLDNRMAISEAPQQISLSLEAGSFDHYASHFKGQWKNDKWTASTKVFYQQAQNDFSYEIAPNLPKRTQSNAALQQWGIMQSLQYQLPKNQTLSFHLWGQKSEREIPPTTTQNSSEAVQNDASLRTTIAWAKTGKQFHHQFRTAYLIDDNHYLDPKQLTDNLNRYQQWSNEWESTFYGRKNLQIVAGVQQLAVAAQTGNYVTTIKRPQVALFTSVKQRNKYFRWQFGWRQEWIQGQKSVGVPSLGIEKSIGQVNIRAKVDRNYRVPTLNNLHWNPGGNPELEAEAGWGQELGIDALSKNKNGESIFFSATVFHRQTNNWILWTRLANSFFYSPQNIAEVNSRGLETSLNYKLEKKNFVFQIRSLYQFTLATNELPILIPRTAVGEQLYYTPKNRIGVTTSLAIKDWQIDYMHQWTGSVRTFSDPLPAYLLANISIKKEWRFTKFKLNTFLNIDNLYNLSYRVIEVRPMPGINGRLGVSVAL